MKKIIFLFCLLSSVIFADEQLAVNGNFAKSSNGLPQGWQFHTWSGFKPDPKTATQNKILTISDITAKHGTCFTTVQRFPARSGDSIQLSFRVKGSGSGNAELYLYTADGRWLNTGARKKIAIKKEWTDQIITLPVTNVPQGETGRIAICFTFSKGSNAKLTQVFAMRIDSPYRGDIAMPNTWKIFAPVDKNFVPPQKELEHIPQQLAGIQGKDIRRVADTIEFSKFAKGAYKGTWLFTALQTPYDCDYSFGAGADWWMQIFVNGKKVMDTMKEGNAKGIRCNNYTATVRLKKGTNIIAARIITGNGSSLKIAGPAELRKIIPGIRLTKIDWVENFDGKKIQSPGNPKIIQREITPGLLTTSGHGVFQTAKTVNLLPSNLKIRISAQESIFSAQSVRINQFADENGKQSPGKLMFRWSSGSWNFSAEIVRPVQDSNLQLVFADSSGKISSGIIPVKELPAVFTLGADASGRFIFQVESLVSSSRTVFSGISACLKNSKTFLPSLLLSPVKGPASVILDNCIIGFAKGMSAERYKPSPAAEFDPVKAGWPMVFHDEFDSNKLDMTKWYFGWKSRKDFMTLKDGKLFIKADWNPQKTALQSGEIYTRQDFQFGYFEAKVKFRKESGWWSSFYLMSPYPTNSFVDGCEIDVYEDYYLRPEKKGGKPRDILDHNLHMRAAGHTKSWNYNSHVPGSLDKFYRIGCKWTPFEISYYMDGKLIASHAAHSPADSVTFDPFNHGIVLAPLKAILAGCVGRSGGNPKDGHFPENFVIDYVRVYSYPGQKDAPEVTMSCSHPDFAVRSGETLRFTANIRPSKAAIKAVYLFDSGFLLEKKTNPPYTFDMPLTAEHYDVTNYVLPGRSGTRIPFSPSIHAYSIFAEDANGKVGFAQPMRKMIILPEKSRPYKGKAALIPGTVKLSEYDEGGQNIAYFDKDPQNQTKSKFRMDEGVDAYPNVIGNVLAGEWMNYTVEVVKEGVYSAELSYGTVIIGNPGYELFIDNRPAGIFNTPATGSWGISGKSKITGLHLTKGQHILRLFARGNGVNVSTLTFVGTNGK